VTGRRLRTGLFTAALAALVAAPALAATNGKYVGSIVHTLPKSVLHPAQHFRDSITVKNGRVTTVDLYYVEQCTNGVVSKGRQSPLISTHISSAGTFSHTFGGQKISGHIVGRHATVTMKMPASTRNCQASTTHYSLTRS
jgi:hypothetical protein